MVNCIKCKCVLYDEENISYCERCEKVVMCNNCAETGLIIVESIYTYSSYCQECYKK